MNSATAPARHSLFDADSPTPMGLAIQGPGGYGKTKLLQELGANSESVLLVDDAHLLTDRRLREILHIVETRQCPVAIAYRPWPRPAALAELAEALKRRGRAVTLQPFTEEQIAAQLGTRVDAAAVKQLHAQTGGVPRFVAWATEAPSRALAHFGPLLDELEPEVRRFLLAAAIDAADEVAEVLAAAKATGMIGLDNRLIPLARQALLTLTPAAARDEVWQHLTDVHLHRGSPVLQLVRSIHALGVRSRQLAGAFETAAGEALAEQPALAAELFAVAAAEGAPVSARYAQAAALAGDLDTALRLADRLVTTASSTGQYDGAPVSTLDSNGRPDGEPLSTVDSPRQLDPHAGGPGTAMDSAGQRSGQRDGQADAATVAATALAHRGQLSRSAELYRWSGMPSSAAFAAIAAAATGRVDELDRFLKQSSAGSPPTLLNSASLLMARGVRETLVGAPTSALSEFSQASALLEPAGRAVLLPDSPAALAALAGLHSGEFDIAESVLDGAIASRMGATLMARRHQLLQAWILMARGKTAAAAEKLEAARNGEGQIEPRDLLFASALEVGIARRNSDLPTLQRSWRRACEAVVRHPVDLFTLLPLGELSVAAARLGELARISTQIEEAHLLLDRLGRPELWATPLHWNGLHAAIICEDAVAAGEHLGALNLSRHTRYGSVVAAAAECWYEMLQGIVEPVRVEAAARGLHGLGMCWEGARLAGQAAIRTSDRRAMTTLLDCARMLQGRPSGRGTEADSASGRIADAFSDPSDTGRLSEREQEVAELVLAGNTYKQIADQLFISAKTVEHHVARMRQRLNCGSRSELLSRLRSMASERSSESIRLPRPRRPHF